MDEKIEQEDWRSNAAGVVVALGGIFAGLEWYYALMLGLAVVGVSELVLKGMPALGYDTGPALVSDNLVSFVSGGAATVASVALFGMEVWVALCVGIVVSILFGSVAGDVPVAIDPADSPKSTSDGADSDSIDSARDAYVNGEISEEILEQEIESTLSDETDTTTEQKDATSRTQLSEPES